MCAKPIILCEAETYVARRINLPSHWHPHLSFLAQHSLIGWILLYYGMDSPLFMYLATSFWGLANGLMMSHWLVVAFYGVSHWLPSSVLRPEFWQSYYMTASSFSHTYYLCIRLYVFSLSQCECQCTKA